MKRLAIGQSATLACLWEVSIPKPGNVHRGADFEDVTFYDFVASAAAIAPALDLAATTGVGKAVLGAIRATRQVVSTNTNLGSVLLLAPLAAVPRDRRLTDGIGDVLAELNEQDAADVYEAIRLAAAGGLGRVEQMDVAGPPPGDLLAAMQAAAERDLVARQYTNAFREVLGTVVAELKSCLDRDWPLTEAVIHTHLHLMARFPDSLIARKCGPGVARDAAGRAEEVIAAGTPQEKRYQRALADLDFWLRADSHRRNPGTTADLVAAGLFAALRDEIIVLPVRWG